MMPALKKRFAYAKGPLGDHCSREVYSNMLNASDEEEFGMTLERC